MYLKLKIGILCIKAPVVYGTYVPHFKATIFLNGGVLGFLGVDRIFLDFGARNPKLQSPVPKPRSTTPLV